MRYLQIDGVYSQELLTWAQGEGICAFGLDFRPKSFNFIQEYMAQELVASLEGRWQVALLFESTENPSIIGHIVDGIKKVAPPLAAIHLEILGPQHPFEWRQFARHEIPFYCQLDCLSLGEMDSQAFKVDPFQRGILLSHDDISSLAERDQLGQFCHHLEDLLKGPLFDQQVAYQTRFGDAPAPTFCELVQTHRRHVMIDGDVESAYRSPNYQKLTVEIEHQMRYLGAAW